MRSVFFSCAEDNATDDKKRTRIKRGETYLAMVHCLMRFLARYLVEAMDRVKSVSSGQVISEVANNKVKLAVCLLVIEAIS